MHGAPVRRSLLVIAHRLRMGVWRLTRPVLFGVRVLMVQDGRVLLVKHVYQPEWFLPGGGLKRSESLEQAARREAREETGAELGAVSLFSADTDILDGITIHNVVYLCEDFRLMGGSDAEIAELRWFFLDALPDDLSKLSRRRIEEYLARRGGGFGSGG
jgi:8-oxo-dGTP pyrophosphatase MutT (NUDIX family)